MARLLSRLGAPGVAIAAVLTVTLVVGFASVALALASDREEPAALTASIAPSNQAATDWPVNANGQTYGSSLFAACPEDEPDLILAEATNGKVGYISRVEAEAVDGSNVKTPEEALAWQAANEGKTHVIPVYELDGTTVIGEFHIGPGRAVEIPTSSE